MLHTFPIVVADSNDEVEFTRLRNGVNTNTQNHNENFRNENYESFMNRRRNSVSFNRGLHETMEYYDDCTKRERNMSEWELVVERRGEGREGRKLIVCEEKGKKRLGGSRSREV